MSKPDYKIEVTDPSDGLIRRRNEDAMRVLEFLRNQLWAGLKDGSASSVSLVMDVSRRECGDLAKTVSIDARGRYYTATVPEGCDWLKPSVALVEHIAREQK